MHTVASNARSIKETTHKNSSVDVNLHEPLVRPHSHRSRSFIRLSPSLLHLAPSPSSSLLFAPTGHERNRGAILILEEAARIDPALFKETIAPLLLVEHTALMGITTPMDEVSVPVRSMSKDSIYFDGIVSTLLTVCLCSTRLGE